MGALENLSNTLQAIPAEKHSWPTWAAAVCLIWYITVASVCALGHVQICRHYSKPPPRANLTFHPRITIIRPVKGPETYLYACLASTFQQAYPKDKVRIRFCVSSRDDPSLPVLEQLLNDFPDHDAQILVEEEDGVLQSGPLDLGPNPKIRNISRAYREARAWGDVVWVIDCNVWVGKHTLGRKVALTRNFKYVHLTPMVMDVTASAQSNHGPQNGGGSFGGCIDECFLSTYHAKFYVAASSSSVTPAVLGKSTMFRISHLDSLTAGKGIDYFSEYICEDQLMGELFWRNKVPEEVNGDRLGRHALCFGDLAIQPTSNMSVRDYWERRVRWIRVRPLTVMVATAVEPVTESLTCSLCGAYALTTLPLSKTYLGIPPTWLSFFLFWLVSVSAWCIMDWKVYRVLQSNASVHADEHTPWFAQPVKGGTQGSRRAFRQWLRMWLAREALALPIWLFAMCGGKKVDWRGKKFWVDSDQKVHEVHGEEKRDQNRTANGSGAEKDRRD